MSVHVEACAEPRLGQVTLTPRIALSPSARADGVLAVFTLGRLALVPVLALSFPALPLVTTIALLLFIVADIYDGELARRYHADGPRRRALDSTVDRIGIDVFLVAAWAAGALPTVVLIAFLVRDGYCALICALMMRRRNVAIKADWLYRTLNLSVAAWAISAPFAGGTMRAALAVGLLAASLVVAVDLTRSVHRVLAAAADVVDGVIDAGGLRRGVVHWYAKAPQTP